MALAPQTDNGLGTTETSTPIDELGAKVITALRRSVTVRTLAGLPAPRWSPLAGYFFSRGRALGDCVVCVIDRTQLNYDCYHGPAKAIPVERWAGRRRAPQAPELRRPSPSIPQVRERPCATIGSSLNRPCLAFASAGGGIHRHP